MRNRAQIALALVLVTGFLGAVVWQKLHRWEPAYEGRDLSSWLTDFDLESAGSPDRATQAVRAIGTNALPVLLRMICTKDPLWKRCLIVFNARQSLIQLRISRAAVIRYRATQGYGTLGTEAKDGVASLIEIMQSERSIEVLEDIAAALGAIGPTAKPAIPVLLKVAGSQNPELRRSAVLALRNIHRWDESLSFERRF